MRNCLQDFFELVSKRTVRAQGTRIGERMTGHLSGVLAAAAAFFLLGGATVAAQPGPPIRVVGAAVTTSKDTLLSVAQVHPLRGRRVLVNDVLARRLLLMDSTLQIIRIVADSAAGADVNYGVRPGRLLGYRGDSAILLDPSSLSMLVLDGEGSVARISATPRPEHISFLTGTTFGTPGFDAKGRLIYRISDPSTALAMAAGGGIIVPTQPDSAPVLRLDIENRKLDTIANVKIQKRLSEPYRSASGTIQSRTLITPMPLVDDWAVMADGSVALIRHRDYHVDWLNADGSRTSSPAMPFEWTRMTDDHKSAFVDSVRKTLADARWKDIARYDSLNYHCFELTPPERLGATSVFVPPRAGAVVVEGGSSASGAGAGAVGGAAAGSGAGGARGAGAGPPGVVANPSTGASPVTTAKRPANCPASAYVVDQMFGELNVISPSMLPDYKPPFTGNSSVGDADGNLWIRVNQMRPVPNTVLYDVVNRSGVLIDRIQIPVSRTLVGFGRGGILYLASKTGNAVRLELVRWRL
jgi:hypothetical protein